MKVMGYAIVSLTYAAVAIIVCIVVRAMHYEHTSLALLLAPMVSIYVGAFLWHRESPTAPLSRVSLAVGSLLVALCVVCALSLHAGFGWIENPEIDIPVSAVAGIFGTYLQLPMAWRALIGQNAGHQPGESVSANERPE